MPKYRITPRNSNLPEQTVEADNYEQSVSGIWVTFTTDASTTVLAVQAQDVYSIRLIDDEPKAPTVFPQEIHTRNPVVPSGAKAMTARYARGGVN